MRLQLNASFLILALGLSVSCRHSDDEAPVTPAIQPQANHTTPQPTLKPTPTPTPKPIVVVQEPDQKPDVPSPDRPYNRPVRPKPQPPVVVEPIAPEPPVVQPKPEDYNALRVLETTNWREPAYATAIEKYVATVSIYEQLSSRQAKLNFIQYLLEREPTCQNQYVDRGSSTPAFVCSHFANKLYMTYRNDKTLSQRFCNNSEVTKYCIQQTSARFRLPIREVTVQLNEATKDPKASVQPFAFHAVNAVLLSATADQNDAASWIFIEPNGGNFLFENRALEQLVKPTHAFSSSRYTKGTILLIDPHHDQKIDREMETRDELAAVLNFSATREEEGAYKSFYVKDQGTLDRTASTFFAHFLRGLGEQAFLTSIKDQAALSLPFALVSHGEQLGDLVEAVKNSSVNNKQNLMTALQELRNSSAFRGSMQMNSPTYLLRMSLAHAYRRTLNDAAKPEPRSLYAFDNIFMIEKLRTRDNTSLIIDDAVFSIVSWPRATKEASLAFFNEGEMSKLAIDKVHADRARVSFNEIGKFYIFDDVKGYPAKSQKVGIYVRMESVFDQNFKKATESCPEGSRLPTEEEMRRIAREIAPSKERGSCLWTSTATTTADKKEYQTIWSFTEKAEGFAAYGKMDAEVCNSICIAPVVYE